MLLTVAKVERFALGDLSWDVAQLRLLTGTLAAHVVLAHGPVTGRGDVAYGLGGKLTLENFVADLVLDPRQLPRVPHEDILSRRQPDTRGREQIETSGRSTNHQLRDLI